MEGASPVSPGSLCEYKATRESPCLRVQGEVGGKRHRRLNMTTSPIANKYSDGKLKRTLKRE